MFQGEGGTLQSLFNKSTSFTNTLADNDQTIEHLIDNLNIVAATLNKDGGKFSGAIDRLERLVTGLSDDRDTFGPAIDALSNGTRHVGRPAGQSKATAVRHRRTAQSAGPEPR